MTGKRSEQLRVHRQKHTKLRHTCTLGCFSVSNNGMFLLLFLWSTTWPKATWEKMLYFIVWLHHGGKPSQELGGGNWSRSHGRIAPLCLFSMLFSLCLIQHRTTCPGVAPLTVGPSKLIANQETTYSPNTYIYTPRPVWWRLYLNWAFLVPGDSSLW